MTENEIGELYTRLAFYYESAIEALLAKEVIDADFAATTEKRFYNSLNEEKIRTSQKIRDYRETIRLYIRKLTCNSCELASFLSTRDTEMEKAGQKPCLFHFSEDLRSI